MAAHQAPLSLGFSRQEYWSGLPFPSLSMHAKSLQSCLTLCHPRDGSPPSSPVPGILQARILEWVAIPFSRGSSQPRSPALQADSLLSEPARKPLILKVEELICRGCWWESEALPAWLAHSPFASVQYLTYALFLSSLSA